MPNNPRIDVAAAIAAARQSCMQLFAPRAKNVQLEEVEQSEDGNFWFVTLSFQAAEAADVFQIGLASKRVYKIVTVDARTGKVRSIKIRALESGGR